MVDRDTSNTVRDDTVAPPEAPGLVLQHTLPNTQVATGPTMTSANGHGAVNTLPAQQAPATQEVKPRPSWVRAHACACRQVCEVQGPKHVTM